jgi:hypothetical protein
MNAITDDEVRWSFVFCTDDTYWLFYCPWADAEDWEFDGEIDGLELPWRPERVRANQIHTSLPEIVFCGSARGPQFLVRDHQLAKM